MERAGAIAINRGNNEGLLLCCGTWALDPEPSLPIETREKFRLRG